MIQQKDCSIIETPNNQIINHMCAFADRYLEKRIFDQSGYL